MNQTGHRQIDHTADLALEVWAPTEERLLVEAARALIEILSDGAKIGSVAQRRAQFEALDAEDRLVAWLNFVLRLALVDGFLLADAAIRLSAHGLEADIAGEDQAFEKIRTEVKSATYHDLSLIRDEESWRARIVIDV